jgi:fluoroquinolone resistance protein
MRKNTLNSGIKFGAILLGLSLITSCSTNQTTKTSPTVVTSTTQSTESLANEISETIQDLDFSGRFLQDQIFSNQDLTQASFENSILRNVHFYGGIMNGVSFKSSSFENVSFSEVNLHSANFDNSNLLDVNFYQTTLNDSSFKETSIKNGRFKSDLTGSDFSSAVFEQNLFYDNQINRVNFTNSTFIDTSFSFVFLGASDFSGANFLDSNFFNSDLSLAKFDNSVLGNVSFSGSNVSGVSLVGVETSNTIGLIPAITTVPPPPVAKSKTLVDGWGGESIWGTDSQGRTIYFCTWTDEYSDGSRETQSRKQYGVPCGYK